MRSIVTFALLAAAAASLAPAATAGAARTRIPLKPLPDTRVGRVDGTRAFIAVSLDNGRLHAYVCDGTLERDPTISTWFRHRWSGRHPLTLRSHGHTLKLRPIGKDGRIRGRLDGAHRFRVRPARMPAGLFKGRKGRARQTWIVLPGRHKRGAMVSTRKPCRFVLVTGANGQQQWVSVCG